MLGITLLQIITESLPVSSSGHVRVAHTLTGRHSSVPRYADFLMHIPTLFVVTLFCAREFWQYLPGIFSNSVTQQQLLCVSAAVFVATFCTVPFYVLRKYTGTSAWPVQYGFFATAACLAGVWFFGGNSGMPLSVYHAVVVGCVLGFAQGVALCVPGLSRMATTVFAGVCMGLSVYASLYYALALQLAVMAPACVWGLYEFFTQHWLFTSIRTCAVYIGVSLGAAVCAYAALGLTEFLLVHGHVWVFVVYMVGLGVFAERKGNV